MHAHSCILTSLTHTHSTTTTTNDDDDDIDLWKESKALGNGGWKGVECSQNKEKEQSSFCKCPSMVSFILPMKRDPSVSTIPVFYMFEDLHTGIFQVQPPEPRVASYKAFKTANSQCQFTNFRNILSSVMTPQMESFSLERL